MLHEWVTLEPDQFWHLHRTVFAYLSQIVSQQVGDHDQFGQFLGAGLEFVGELAVAHRVGGARTCAFDGACLNVRSAQAQKHLWRRRHDLEFTAVEKRGERRGRNGGQPLKKIPAGQ